MRDTPSPGAIAEVVRRVYDDDGDDGGERETWLEVGGGRPVRVRLLAAAAAGDPTRPNEDAFGWVERPGAIVAGVFDGMTSLKPIPALEARGITGARFAARFLAYGLESFDLGVDPSTILMGLNRALGRAIADIPGTDPADVNSLPASTATIVAVDPDRDTLALAAIHDSWCVVCHHGGSRLLTEDRNARFDRRALDLIGEIARRRGITPRAARADAAVQRLLEAQRVEKLNAPDGSGCGAVNGDPRLEPYIQNASIPLSDLDAVLLGTDGLVPPGWNLERERDRQRLLNAIQRGGLARLLRLKREIEDADPDWRHVRFKHSDDATGCFLALRPH